MGVKEKTLQDIISSNEERVEGALQNDSSYDDIKRTRPLKDKPETRNYAVIYFLLICLLGIMLAIPQSSLGSTDKNSSKDSLVKDSKDENLSVELVDNDFKLLVNRSDAISFYVRCKTGNGFWTCFLTDK